MENTLENKILFYAVYFNQTVRRSWLPEQNHYLSKVDAGCFSIPHLIINSQLELKNIKDITKEHLLYIAHMYDLDHTYTADELYEDIDGLVELFNIRGTECDHNISVSTWQQIIDFLRSEGYLVGFHSLLPNEIIEYEWAFYRKS